MADDLKQQGEKRVIEQKGSRGPSAEGPRRGKRENIWGVFSLGYGALNYWSCR